VSSLIAFVIFKVSHSPAASCHTPVKRKEWRSLDRSQQQEYINSVQCLMQKPSVVEPGTYLYDDFAYTHVQDGAKSHYAGAFLAWHRYFIHLYEKALIEQCGLTIPLP
jgi:tyrosinase